jgi:hypothetical protein
VAKQSIASTIGFLSGAKEPDEEDGGQGAFPFSISVPPEGFYDDVINYPEKVHF